jgi:hypothetical protein
MQQVAHSEPDGGQRPRRRRRPTKPDRGVTVLKIATVLVGAGVIGLIILMASGWPNEVAGRVPVPTPPTSGPSGDDAKPYDSRTAEPSPTMIAPPLRAETSLVAPKPAPPSTPKPAPTTTPPRQQPPGFTPAVIGQPCPEPGLFSLTSNYEPVVCWAEPPSDQPRWQRMF